MGLNSKKKFGTFYGIELDGMWVDINQDKLKEPYSKKFNEQGYIKVAKELAKKYVANEWDETEQKAFEAVCLIAAADRNTLKGKFVVSAFIEIELKRNSKGKHFTLSNKQIEQILLHHAGKLDDITQKDFCKLSGISKPTYNRVINRKYVHKKDIERIDQIEGKLELESKLFTNVTP